MNNVINIADTTVRMDEDGRYCLNDFHKAAGEQQKDRPKYWLENDQTLALVNELEKGGIPPITATKGVGTFVVKQLVYAYAMWISPEFSFKVIDAFDTLQTRGVAVADHAAQDLLDNPRTRGKTPHFCGISTAMGRHGATFVTSYRNR